MLFPRLMALVSAAFVLFSCVQIDIPAPSPALDLDVKAVEDLSGAISTSEWLGPMAPIALSPFFGITCLSGMSVFGEGTFLASNQFVSENPVLNQQAVFWIFLTLTVLTSLPRLTKVSKPIAQILDQVETYAGIITLIIIRFMAQPVIESGAVEESMVLKMGVLSFSADLLLMVAAAINIFVINLVKFFFEALIWLTPFPMIDALFEVCNKTVCAALMLIYAWSPFAAMLINLVMFAICAIMFRWVYRNVVYMRTILADPVWKLIRPKYGDFDGQEQLVVFAQNQFAGFPKKSKLIIRRSEGGWELIRQRLPILPVQSIQLSDDEQQIRIQGGLLLNKLVVTGSHEGNLIFSRRFSGQLDQVAEKLAIEFEPAEETGTSDGGQPAIA